MGMSSRQRAAGVRRGMGSTCSTDRRGVEGRKRSLVPPGVSGQNIFSSCTGGTLGGAVPCEKVAGLPTVSLATDELLASCSAAAFEWDVMWWIIVKPANF